MDLSPMNPFVLRLRVALAHLFGYKFDLFGADEDASS